MGVRNFEEVSGAGRNPEVAVVALHSPQLVVSVYCPR